MPSTPRPRATIAALAVAALGTLGTVCSTRAASLFDLDVWMRAVDKRSVDVQRNIDARKIDAATADAQELARLYGLMEAFFAADGHVQDAVDMSRSGKDLAASISTSLATQDFDGATKAAVTLAHACNDCHDPHKPFN